jgi:hypothetical protein
MKPEGLGFRGVDGGGFEISKEMLLLQMPRLIARPFVQLQPTER